MKIKYEVLSMHNFLGGMVGWLAFQKTVFEKACYVWDADVAGDDPQFAGLVKHFWKGLKNERLLELQTRH